MTNEFERSVADEIADIRMERPHVVVLGAGASRAACPNGDKNGKLLPLMADFANCIGLAPLLQGWGVDPEQNFEDTYSNLSDVNEHTKLDQLNRHVEKYFCTLKLPDYPTIYDHLVLSLREKDVIATFNWDPLPTSGVSPELEGPENAEARFPTWKCPGWLLRDGSCVGASGWSVSALRQTVQSYPVALSH